MNTTDEFVELAPDNEMQKLISENKQLEEEIRKISFESVKLKSKESLEEHPLSSEQSTEEHITYNQFPSKTKEYSNSFMEMSFKPLPFEISTAKESDFDATKLNCTKCPNSPPKVPTRKTLNFTSDPEQIDTGLKPRDDHQSAFQTVGPSQAKNIAEKTSAVDEVARRLVGEVAFQLDRRILQHVFKHRRRLYGFNVRNLSQKIAEYSEDFVTGKVDSAKRETLLKRKDSTFKHLQQRAGYNPRYHPAFAEMLVNRFGVLRLAPSKKSDDFNGLRQADHIKSIMLNVLPPELTYDALILLDALVAFADFDGKPLLIW